MTISDTVIHVDNISKQYRIGAAQERHDTLRDQLVGSARRIFSHRTGQDGTNLFWALRDISFEVKQGEVLGIIGRNGAGKSTLLKILSQITEPTAGRAIIDGRVGSLLEVGTGFHPELTGRENIYLNGAILGMSRREITAKFDEIVDFAEIEKFLDTPVKRYSSGMYVRLAFAVAAQLEPDILLVDEVLAVGDAGFQKKCLGKMSEVATQGRTVLFVSHNMAAIQGLCSRAIALKDGNLILDGPSRKVVEGYLSSDIFRGGGERAPGIFNLENRKNNYADGKLLARNLTIYNHENQASTELLMGLPIKITIEIVDVSSNRDATVTLIIKNKYGDRITSIDSGWSHREIEYPRKQKEIAILTINKLPLTPGHYTFDVSVFQYGVGRIDYVEKAAEITVIETDIYGSGTKMNESTGFFYLDGYWEIKSKSVD